MKIIRKIKEVGLKNVITGCVKRVKYVSEKNPITVIYHNPVYMELFEQEGKVTILKQLYDKTKDYTTYIFRMT